MTKPHSRPLPMSIKFKEKIILKKFLIGTKTKTHHKCDVHQSKAHNVMCENETYK